MTDRDADLDARARRRSASTPHARPTAGRPALPRHRRARWRRGSRRCRSTMTLLDLAPVYRLPDPEPKRDATRRAMGQRRARSPPPSRPARTHGRGGRRGGARPDRRARTRASTPTPTSPPTAPAARPPRSTPPVAAGRPVGPLAGVPFAVKNLFDVDGPRRPAPARRSIASCRRRRATASSSGGCTRPARSSSARSTWASTPTTSPARTPTTAPAATRTIRPGCRGGSSSGCGAATAAGLAPVSLGSDTNGSIRVPSSLCGIFGLKPTYGRLGRSGTFPFVDSLDHLGPFARTARDLALAYDALQGPDPADHACAGRRCAGAAGTSPPDARACASASPAATSPTTPARRRGPRVARVADALARARRRAGRPRRRRRRPRRRLPHHQLRGRRLPPRPPAHPRGRLRPRHPRPLPRRRAPPRRLGRPGAARPPLVARADARHLPRRRPRRRAGDARSPRR